MDCRHGHRRCRRRSFWSKKPTKHSAHSTLLGRERNSFVNGGGRAKETNLAENTPSEEGRQPRSAPPWDNGGGRPQHLLDLEGAITRNWQRRRRRQRSDRAKPEIVGAGTRPTQYCTSNTSPPLATSNGRKGDEICWASAQLYKQGTMSDATRVGSLPSPRSTELACPGLCHQQAGRQWVKREVYATENQLQVTCHCANISITQT